MRLPPGIKQTAEQKLSRIPIRPSVDTPPLRKPPWIRIRLEHAPQVHRMRELLRTQSLHTVCEEASCPNLTECFGHGTATFMILGDLCTRRCPFCDVAHGRPLPIDAGEPKRLAETVSALGLHYVVITSVDRDDLRDGGATHFAQCVREVRKHNPGILIEILVPDFRGRLKRALTELNAGIPDVFNHNIETVPQLYQAARPGADYRHSLKLLSQFKQAHPDIPTKSGLMLGLGETQRQVQTVMQDLFDNGCQMLTLGQYLQPTRHHLPVQRYLPPEEFKDLKKTALQVGFTEVASAPLVRSSYRADRLAMRALRKNPASPKLAEGEIRTTTEQARPRTVTF